MFLWEEDLEGILVIRAATVRSSSVSIQSSVISLKAFWPRWFCFQEKLANVYILRDAAKAPGTSVECGAIHRELFGFLWIWKPAFPWLPTTQPLKIANLFKHKLLINSQFLATQKWSSGIQPSWPSSVSQKAQLCIVFAFAGVCLSSIKILQQ